MLVGMWYAGDTIKLRGPPKDFCYQAVQESWAVARVMTSGTVTTQEYDPPGLGGEMGNLQPSP